MNQNKGTPNLYKDENNPIPIEVFDSRYMNVGEGYNSDLNLNGNKIINVTDSEDIVTRTYIDNNINASRNSLNTKLNLKVDKDKYQEYQVNVLSQFATKVDKTRFDEAISRKVDKDNYQSDLLLYNESLSKKATKLDLDSKLDKSEFNKEITSKADKSELISYVTKEMFDANENRALQRLASRVENTEILIDGKVDKFTNLNMNDRKISNLAAGSVDSDAVTLNQLRTSYNSLMLLMDNQKVQMENIISALRLRIDEMKRINNLK